MLRKSPFFVSLSLFSLSLSLSLYPVFFLSSPYFLPFLFPFFFSLPLSTQLPPFCLLTPYFLFLSFFFFSLIFSPLSFLSFSLLYFSFGLHQPNGPKVGETSPHFPPLPLVITIDSVFSIGMGLSLLKPPSRSVEPSRPATYTERVVSEPLSRSIGLARLTTCIGRVVLRGCAGRLSNA